MYAASNAIMRSSIRCSVVSFRSGSVIADADVNIAANNSENAANIAEAAGNISSSNTANLVVGNETIALNDFSANGERLSGSQ